MESKILSNRTSYPQRILLFFCSFILCLAINAFINIILIKFGGGLNAKTIRISVILQNLIAFILPVLITVVFISTQPIKFLQIGKKPPLSYILFTILIFIVSSPAMNWLVELNKSITLPESMSNIEQWMRQSEDDAAAFTNLLLNNNSILSLIVSVLSIGVLTGFGEELFFRGMFQRIIATRPTNIHIAIWVSAFFFSAFHFQFFGFFPRLFLGAFFGYLLWWSGSLWVPIIAHILNNSTIVILNYAYKSEDNIFNSYGADISTFPTEALASVVLTALIITFFLLWQKKQAQHALQ